MSNRFSRTGEPGTGWRPWVAGVFMAVLGGAAAAQAELPYNVADVPALGSEWRVANPYRGNAEVARAGGVAFNHNCARCHGVDAVASGMGGMPAPDLRRLARACRRIKDAALQSACMDDDDDYFRVTVLEGKTVVGVQHMPAWKGQLTQETIWALKTYVDARGAEGKR
ncbi:c-type cytochrome [uncultured Azohydromonas sp.]|jgi:Cytochrome c.|uniref:c-type cytochrome n=1 Tax=uncultured Azohydromonas sp. TaxID=487342 RepID=UPI002607D442|nr:c-type cytochrome [uncultured Azohydromonas sp.]